MKFYSFLLQLSKISAKTSLSETTGESGIIAALMSDPKKLFTVLAIYAAAAIIGYLAGGFSLSYILARRRGFDIRKTGTKNAGASNAAVTMGWKIGVLVGACDIFKGFAAVLIILVSLLSDYIVMGTMVTMVSFPVYNILWKKSAVAAIVTATLSLYIIYRHRKNLDDILHGRERRISGLYKKKKE